MNSGIFAFEILENTVNEDYDEKKNESLDFCLFK
jgi:hypothetical protein